MPEGLLEVESVIEGESVVVERIVWRETGSSTSSESQHDMRWIEGRYTIDKEKN